MKFFIDKYNNANIENINIEECSIRINEKVIVDEFGYNLLRAINTAGVMAEISGMPLLEKAFKDALELTEQAQKACENIIAICDRMTI